MTEREAWLRLWWLWSRAKCAGDTYCVQVRKGWPHSNCLCWCIQDMADDRLITRTVGLAMMKRIRAEGRRRKTTIGENRLWSTDAEGARQRAAFCRRQAAKCEGVTT